MISGNVISGNVGSGVSANAGAGTSNTINNNLIGVDIDHALDGNGGAAGITVRSGSVFANGNTIGANFGNGVLLDRNSSGSVFTGNFVGTDSSLATGLGNAADGFIVLGSNNVIGVAAPLMGNVIAYNQTAGVFIQTGQGNQIRGNSIFSNLELGIGLGSESAVLPNDTPVVDSTTSNNNQNYPLIATVSGTGNGTFTVTGTMHGCPNTVYVLDFYSNTVADPTNYGEGETFLGSYTTVASDASGNVSFSRGDDECAGGPGVLERDGDRSSWQHIGILDGRGVADYRARRRPARAWGLAAR